MRVLRIILRDFLSYADLDLDLSDVHVAAIVGKVGAGKSSLLDSIIFALYGETRYATLGEAIRDGAEDATVRLDFEASGETYTIERTINRSGVGNSLRFLRSNEDVLSNERRHTMPETQRAIVQKIGLNYYAIRAGALMIQDQSGNFMAMDPRQRKTLLTRLLGLDRYEAALAEAKALAAGYTREASAFESQILTLRTIVEEEDEVRHALRTARVELSEAQAEYDRVTNELAILREKKAVLAEKARHADSLRQTVEMLRQRITSDEQEQRRLLKEISAAHQATDAPEPVFNDLPDVSDEEVARHRKAYDDALKAEVDLVRTKNSIAQLDAEIVRLDHAFSIVSTVPCGGEGIYATCRFLSTAPSAQEVSAAKGRLATLQATMVEMTAPVASPDALLASYEALVAQRSSVENERVKRESVVEQWKLKVAQAEQTVRSGKDQMRRLATQVDRDKGILARSIEQLQQVDSDKADIDAVEMAIGSVTSSIEETKRSIDIVYQPAVRRAEETLTRITAAKEQLAPLEKQLRESTEKAAVYTLLTKAFHRNGVPTYILETHIPLIEQRANEVLDRMPDSYVVRLVSQSQDRLTIIVETNGRTRAYEGLSGGEKFRVDFAVRVALSQLQAGLSGTSWGTYIIDEGFGSQDDEGIDAMLESIAAIEDEFGLILAISHQKALSDRVERHIEVSRDEEGSTAVLR